jgi:hypothetical protein
LKRQLSSVLLSTLCRALMNTLIFQKESSFLKPGWADLINLGIEIRVKIFRKFVFFQKI